MLPNRFRIIIITRNVLVFLIFITIIFIYKIKSLQNEEISKLIFTSEVEYLFLARNTTNRKLNHSEIESIVVAHNREDTILNEEIFGPVRKDTVVFVIFVHETSMALKLMLLSLSRVKGIQEVLLIFSHLYYDEFGNALIKTIDFCRVLQIYYPHSLQLHPNSFPGYTAGDCPHYLNVRVAEYLNCTGVLSYDIHGYYRNPQLAEKKHHWWWTANQVFENLTSTDGHDGTFVFFEDYYFLMEDFLYMTLYMKKLASSLARCELLSLATKHLPAGYEEKQDAVEVVSWDPALHSGVLAFDLSVWNNIVSHHENFCYVDDNSWAQSLSYLSMNRRDGGRYKVMSSVFPRAYKLTACIYLGKFIDCNDVSTSVYQILNLQKRSRNSSFPPIIEVSVDIELDDEYLSFDYVTSNGGWNDPRDHALCENITVNKIKKEILDMNYQFEIFSSSVEK